MKKFIFSLAFIPVFLGAQTTTVQRTVDAFTGVESSSLVTIELVPGSPCAVTLEGESADVQSITTEVKEGTLHIAQDGKSNGGPVKVIVTISELKKIDVGGPVELTGKGTFTTDSVSIDGSGGSQLELNVTATAVRVDLSGASSLRLCGTTTRLHAKTSGASDLRSGCLESQRTKAETSGASHASVSASQSIEGRSSGASDLIVYGNPTEKNVESSGAASVDVRSGSGASDTTRISIGGRNVDISHDPDERSKREKKATDDDFEYWEGFDLGVNGLMTYDNKFTMPPGLKPFELNYVKSYVFGWNIWQKNIHVYRNYVNIGTGIGFSWYHYNWRGSYSLQPNVDFTNMTMDSLNYSRNRLNICYVNIPLMLEFNTNTERADRSFHIAGGMQFGYNIFKNKLKQKYELDGETYKRKIKDDFNVNPFKIDLIARIGFGQFTIFGTYSLTALFEDFSGPQLYPFTAGINLDF